MLGFIEKVSYWLSFGAHLLFREFCENISLAIEFGPIQGVIMELDAHGLGGCWRER